LKLENRGHKVGYSIRKCIVYSESNKLINPQADRYKASVMDGLRH